MAKRSHELGPHKFNRRTKAAVAQTITSTLLEDTIGFSLLNEPLADLPKQTSSKISPAFIDLLLKPQRTKVSPTLFEIENQGGLYSIIASEHYVTAPMRLFSPDTLREELYRSMLRRRGMRYAGDKNVHTVDNLDANVVLQRYNPAAGDYYSVAKLLHQESDDGSESVQKLFLRRAPQLGRRAPIIWREAQETEADTIDSYLYAMGRLALNPATPVDNRDTNL